MKANEMRQLSAQELGGKIRQWENEVFRARIKKFTSELKDTSMFKKLKKDIARGKHVLSMMQKDTKASPVAEDKGVKANDK